MDFGIKEQLRAEYETTGQEVTIDSLCDKYKVSKSVLGDTSDWTKVTDIDLPLEEVETEVVSDAKPIDLIEQIKMTLLANLKGKIDTYGEQMFVKDLKEAASTIDILEKSYTKHSDSGNINIIVQNIVSKFTDDV